MARKGGAWMAMFAFRLCLVTQPSRSSWPLFIAVFLLLFSIRRNLFPQSWKSSRLSICTVRRRRAENEMFLIFFLRSTYRRACLFACAAFLKSSL